MREVEGGGQRNRGQKEREGTKERERGTGKGGQRERWQREREGGAQVEGHRERKRVGQR